MKLNDHKVDYSLILSCVSKLKERYPHLSSSQIAKKVGIGRSTLNRIENGFANPGLNTLIKLLSFLGEHEKLSGVLEFASDPKQIEEKISHNVDSVILGGLTKHLNHSDYRGILLLIMASAQGSTWREIEREYGRQGMRIVRELIEMEIVTESSGELKIHPHYYDGESTYATDQKTNQNSLLYCLKEKYDHEKFGTERNWLSFQTDSVNKEKAMKLIRAELKKAYTNIDKIIRSEKFKGNDKIFVGLVTDTLTKEVVQ